MRIVLFAQGLTNRAGIERMTVELSNLLADYYDVYIVLIEDFNRKDSPYIIDDKVNIVSLKSAFSILNVRNIFMLRAVLRNIAPNVVITVATPLVRISAPAVMGLGIRNIAWEHFNLYAGSRKGIYWKLLSTYLVDRTVVLTNADARNFRNRKCKNIVVIPNFTSIERNIPSKCNSNIILAVGRHANQKGFDLLIKAWAKANVFEWKLKIVGSGELKEKNISLAKELGVIDSIIFQDSTPEIVKEYQSASCFILSSRFEGLVMVMIEAKMMGLPCISFDCPTGPSEIIRDGIDGWLVDNGNISALAETIRLALSSRDVLRERGRMARVDALMRYSPDAIKNKWIELLEKLEDSENSTCNK